MIFRYPGGKTRLLGFLAPFQDTLAMRGKDYLEPFVGGGATLLQMAARHGSHQIIANDLDPWLAAFWRCVSSPSEPSVLLSLMEATPTISLFRDLRATGPSNDEEAAYRAVFFNRTTFSGIITSGPIGGYEQKSAWSIGCRYNAERLIQEVRRARVQLSGRLSVTEMDGIEFLSQYGGPAYLDPPYFVKGTMLYRAKFPAHKELAAVLRSRENWVLSYDDCPEIRSMYAWADIKEEPQVRYSVKEEKDKSRKGTNEVVITSRGLLPRRLMEN